MSDDASQRLDELKLLWESDPSSKVYLQLASAYRQKGQPDKAIEVLETSLQHRPRDPRGRVALARCKMEISDFAAAAELLEEVIRQDAAHLEANKQLLECYLRIGDAERAEERLGIYKLLNDRDPELAHLEYRLQSLGSSDGGESAPGTGQDEAVATREVFFQSPAPAAPSPAKQPISTDGAEQVVTASTTTPPAAGVPAATVEPAYPESFADPVPAFEPQVAAPPAVEPPPVVEPPPAVEPPPVVEPPHLFEPPPAVEPPPVVDASADAEDVHRPIPGLPPMTFAVADPEDDDADVVPPAREPAGEPPFAREPQLAAPAAEPEFPDASFAATPVEAMDAEPSSADDDLFELAPEPAAEESDPWGGDLFELAPAASAQAASVDDLDGLWDQTEAVEFDDEDETDEAAAAVPTEAGEKATATLGLLYLRQGHLDEANQIFRKVLDLDPDNEAALAGLQQLEVQRAVAAEVPAQPDAQADDDVWTMAEAEAEAETEAPEAVVAPPVEPSPAVFEEPVEAFEPEPVEAFEPEPVEAFVPEPEPVEVFDPEPVEAATAEPPSAEPVPAEPARPEPAPAVAATDNGSAGARLTAQVLLGRLALDSAVPDDATGRKIAVLQQYIQHIRTASRDHVH